MNIASELRWLNRTAFWIAMFQLANSVIVRGEAPRFDLSKDKVLYCVGYAHLDTQWRWDYCTTIDRYVRDTLEHNFQRMEQFPEYVFNFTGSVRYEMMKEYYPEKYDQLKKYIADGRWYVSGSSVDEGDVNVPSPEAIMRQVLYGNQYFRREFGKESVDFMLPDCFGFPASMPSIWAHCGLRGFSTQKLTWGSAMGIPFKVGVWEGLDGKSVIAAFDPGPYVGAIKGRVDTNPEWVNRVNENGRKYGLWADYHYYGVGDQGGAPREEDVRNYVASMNQPDGQIKVALVSSDQMFKDITEEQRSRLPRYKGDLLLTEHSAGTLTSQSYMKRWNRKNEVLADAAERAAVTAAWLDGAAYPREKLYRSWVRLLANQMHDILPGTSIPRAYTYSWNDEVVALNGFAAVLESSTGAITQALDTKTPGIPLIVYNPLAIEREEVVEAKVPIDHVTAMGARVFDPSGKESPSQVLRIADGELRVLFLARTPPVSWSVFHVRPAEQRFAGEGELQVAENGMENEFYRVAINENGDVASIVDKKAGGRELLAAPARLVFTHERPQQWPAWNMDWADRQKAPIDAFGGPARIRIVERGPVRVALEIEREARNSIVRQRICLARGDAGRRIEFHTEVDWQTPQCALKASFPLAVSNPRATYNWGLGTIERGNNEPTKYEVPSHEWFDLTDRSGEYGVTVLEDCKYGSDKPSDHEVRLTLLYTPGVRHSYLDQHSQDWGRHEMTYALYGHRGGWRDARSEWQGRRLNQPLRVWEATRHEGTLGRSFSFLKINTEQVDIRAVKLAEDSDKIIVRLQELWGKEAERVEVTFAGGVRTAEEVDGQERLIGPAIVEHGKLLTKLTPYSPKSFAVELANPTTSLRQPQSVPVALEFDSDVVSRDGHFGDGKFDAEGRSIPAEMLPERIVSEGIEFRLGPTGDGQLNALTCRGQVVRLPDGPHEQIYLLAASDQDVTARFSVDGRSTDLGVQSWTDFVGQWDDRVWDREFGEVDHTCQGQVTGIRTGFIKRDNIAWFCTHRHHPVRGNEAYKFSYLYKYVLYAGDGALALHLPNEPRVKILAVSVGRKEISAVRPAAPLYDDYTGRQPIRFRHVYPLPPTPVHQGVTAVGQVVVDRQDQFASLRMGPPVSDDYVDQAAGHGVSVQYFDGGGDFRPHSRSGAKGDTLPRLNDGLTAENDDDTQRSIWYDHEGRFYVDLKRPLPISRINTFSWHRGNRAPQRFSVWGSGAETMPDPAFGNKNHGPWTLLGVVNTKELGEGGVHGSSVEPLPDQKMIGEFRHLLWVAEDVGQGTFFTEIDVHVQK